MTMSRKMPEMGFIDNDRSAPPKGPDGTAADGRRSR